jgi:hypothetical protein
MWNWSTRSARTVKHSPIRGHSLLPKNGAVLARLYNPSQLDDRSPIAQNYRCISQPSRNCLMTGIANFQIVYFPNVGWNEAVVRTL